MLFLERPHILNHRFKRHQIHSQLSRYSILTTPNKNLQASQETNSLLISSF